MYALLFRVWKFVAFLSAYCESYWLWEGAFVILIITGVQNIDSSFKVYSTNEEWYYELYALDLGI